MEVNREEADQYFSSAAFNYCSNHCRENGRSAIIHKKGKGAWGAPEVGG
jgi:hypothetical protein